MPNANMGTKDACTVLGVEWPCDWTLIRKAFIRQAKTWHPDVAGLRGVDRKVASRRMALLNQAYATLRFREFGQRFPVGRA